ncbi:hypothetical protein GCM10011514_27090 [Emticicia aquatilis]|uniref:RDD domain-containing protein n=1 Tax=Emticicia aquatilis TaxID=1537369 RepID=A0A916YUW2_9BACT|nr:RDD family protein [Emticicia aquatilis]GGD61621.1 hypothetical protein GCM10011514_27090 [Emticicia aquatilis]
MLSYSTDKPLLILLRSLARLIDLILLYWGFGLFYSWINRNNSMAYDRLFNGIQEMGYYLPICMLYVPIMESITKGFTVGKFICRIKVRKFLGLDITPKEAFLRWTGGVLDFVCTLGLAAIISAIISEKTQRLGDRLAKTIVERV